MKNKILTLLFTFIICLCLFPSITFAETITQKTIWNRATSSGGLGFSNQTYNTKGYGERQTKYLGGWNLDSGNGSRVFCVEPGTAFPTNGTVSGYTSTTTAPNGNWDISGDVVHLEKVLSCWSNNSNSITATQAIVWELISEERSSINASQIFSGDYTPYQSDGTVYGNSNRPSLFMRIKAHSDTYAAYKAVLRCAARFNIKPSFSYESDSTAKSSAQILSSYDDETQTFSKTFKHSSSVDSNLLKYYEVTSDNSDVKVSKTATGITVSTTKEYKAKTDAIKITLKYTYKDDGTSKLNNDGPLKFYVKSKYQSLAMGSTTKETYLYVYTGAKPTYQLRVQKLDEDGNPMSGIKFNVYSDSSLKTKVGTTTASDKSGWASLTGIKKIGKYYVQEAETPDGYVTNKEIVTVDVKGEHRTGSTKWPTASSVFTNKFTHLNLSKRTIDETGKEISISDYTGKSCTGNYIGPVFTIKKGNSDVCVTPISGSPGHYKLASCTDSGATKEIKTCDGKFDIEGITSGCYDITETTAPDGYTLPQNPTQQVCVTKGESATATVMYNGVSGVIFNKVTENGNPIDGGKFALQQKVNGVYRDMLLKHDTGAIYVYEDGLKEDTESVGYVLETSNGTINVKNLPPGEYRFVEKEAPEGYDAISDKDSKATFTISDKGIFGSDGKPATDYYQVKMVNQQTRVEGSYDSAELIVTIITGRKVINYAIVIVGLAALLIALIVLRKKFKK